MEFTEKEKEILSLMFSNMENYIKVLGSENFNHNDLFQLAEKIGINY